MTSHTHSSISYSLLYAVETRPIEVLLGVLDADESDVTTLEQPELRAVAHSTEASEYLKELCGEQHRFNEDMIAHWMEWFLKHKPQPIKL